MSNLPEAPEIRVVFDEEGILAYGGSGAGIHSDVEAAKAAGFPRIISWGTGTLMPFWEILERMAGEDCLIGGSASVRLRKPVCAGDEVVYSGRELVAPQGRRTIELTAATVRDGVVATLLANLALNKIDQP